MLTLHPQFITDINGDKSFVILPTKEFNTILEELEDIEDVRLYDESKKDGENEHVLFSDYLKTRNIKND
jgi:hypothetical protein